MAGTLGWPAEAKQRERRRLGTIARSGSPALGLAAPTLGAALPTGLCAGLLAASQNAHRSPRHSGSAP